jgi:putative DNA primase/helicase
MFDRPCGIGVVCGQSSGNLELLEFEGRAVADGTFDRWVGMVTTGTLAPSAHGLLTGYCETTPSGGIHLLYRVDNGPVPGNTKLARRINPSSGKVEVLAETRGQGGYVVTAPTPGTGHATGRPWEMMEGSFASIPTLSGPDHWMLLTFARILDEMPAEVEVPHSPRREPQVGELAPGDDFNQRADWLHDVLIGWQVDRVKADVTYLVKPGSHPRDGHHATIGYGGSDLLYNFSTAAWPLEAEESYSKFGAYAVIHHGGDFKAAARELARRGYGTKGQPIKRRRWRDDDG